MIDKVGTVLETIINFVSIQMKAVEQYLNVGSFNLGFVEHHSNGSS